MKQVGKGEEIDIRDLHFGCLNWNPNSRKLEPFDLFRSVRVLDSIANYRLRKEELELIEWFGGEFDPVRYCFGNLWGHVEYEMMVSEMIGDKTEKMSLYEMYVLPNKEILMDMVEQVSLESCEKWLKERK